MLKSVVRLLGFVVLAGILYFIDFRKLSESLLGIHIGSLLLSLVVVLPLYLIKSARWYFLLKTQGIRYSYWNSLLAWSSANFIAFITPGRIGEVARAFYLKKDTNIPITATLPTVFLDRLFDVYFLLAVAAAGFFRFSMLDRFQAVSWISISVIVFLPWLLLKKKFSITLLGGLLRLPGLRRFEARILSSAEHFFEEMKKLLNIRLLFGAALTACAYLALFGTCYVLVQAADIPIDFVTISVFTAVANVLSFVPISVSGVGTREASLIFLFSLVGLSAEAAVLYSTLFFFNFYLVGGLIGYACFLIKPIDIASVKSVKAARQSPEAAAGGD